jgi:FKBP-type peptidyl-prolyl cis-trans isomerase
MQSTITKLFYNKISGMKISNIFWVAGITALAISCNNVDFKKTKGGMPYKLYESKSGAKVAPGKFVKVNIEQKVKDSVVFTSFNSLPIYFPVQPSSQPYDISEVFTTLKEGDSVYAEQLMDTFIKKNPMILQQTKFKNGDKITTKLKVIKVFNTAEEARKDEEGERMAYVKKEEVDVKNYLSKNNIGNTQRTGSGAYVQVLNAGNAPQVVPGKYVTVMYKGQTFGGKVFDSNMDPSFGHTEPMGFTVGVGQMIKGFDEGVQLLSKGGKAKMFIPSMLAYGPQPPSPEIKPFENLIFDVEVVDVLDKAPAQPAMPQQQQQNVDVPQTQR